MKERIYKNILKKLKVSGMKNVVINALSNRMYLKLMMTFKRVLLVSCSKNATAFHIVNHNLKSILILKHKRCKPQHNPCTWL